MRRLLALLFLATALAPGVHAAAPPCLDLTTDTLDVRRALASVRDAIDTGCPCDGARKAFQRCAKEAITTALADGSLPAACAKTVKQAAKTSSCGLASKVPCGRIATSDGAASCGLASEKRCKDTRKADATACTAETWCSDVTDWTAGTCHDVREYGPYAPGVRVQTFTKASVVDGSPRPLETVIWYPAPAGSGPIDPNNTGVVDAPIAPGGPYPVIMFSHGSCGYARQSMFLTPLLASYGFVVVAVPHPGNQVFELPQCGTPQAQVNSFRERQNDIIFVLDRMLEQNGSADSVFLGTLAPERIGMMGHSFGGLTTYRVAGIDDRIKVAVPMAPAVLGEPALTMPSLTVLGGIDSVVDPEAPQKAFADSAKPKFQVVVEHSGHYTVSDGCFAGPDCKPPTTLTQPEAHALALRYIVPFLEVYLAGDESFRPLLETQVPGVQLTAEP
jgi:dienelactone hydrolase